MCLVSYIPQPDGFILSSNRDESPLRGQTELSEEKINDFKITFPKDHKGGSWIIGSSNKLALCVLNGAFNNHKRVIPYKLSRGLMVKKYFEYASTSHFLKEFDFDGIEPFTLIIRDNIGLYEFRWDGQYKYIKQLNPQKAYVWSSCTLYTSDMQKQRSKLFFELLEKGNDLKQIQDIHLTGKLGDPENDFRMNRADRVATISHTNLVFSKTKKMLFLNNLISNNTSQKEI